MTIGRQGDLQVFSELREIKMQMEKEFGIELGLSMGMSGDYLQAVQEGSTSVRIGSSIFG
jgi:uncharacterized pyridoxal phosphate-containing UPF0001 family protein